VLTAKFSAHNDKKDYSKKQSFVQSFAPPINYTTASNELTVGLIKNIINKNLANQMKFKILDNLTHTPEKILRTCGYFPIFDHSSQKASFVKKITANRYPRFHLYLKKKGENLIFDLHLDQSKAVYSGAKAHNADYESPEVKQELVLIFQAVKKHIPSTKQEQQPEPTNPPPIADEKNQPNWLSKLFKK